MDFEARHRVIILGVRKDLELYRYADHCAFDPANIDCASASRTATIA